MTRRPKIALATAARLPAGMEDTANLLRALDNVGLDADIVDWSAADVDWAGYSAIMLHSPWDYTEHVGEFLGWVAAEGGGDRMLNPSNLISWNADKRYLLELQGNGVALPRTVLGERGEDLSVDQLRAAFGGCQLVVKPVVSAGGRRVWLCGSVETAREILLRHAADEPVLVQEYQRSVETVGEYSAVFLAGELSHTVRKLPKPGEFRVQSHYGGRTRVVESEAWIVDYGRAVLAAVAGPTRYARVDFVVDDADRPQLVELELIEPDLFLRYAPESSRRLAEIIAKVIVD